MELSLLLSQIKPRVQRLGLVDPQTGFYDESEITFYVQEACRYLANCYQLQHFLKMNRELFRTVDGIESYAIAANYGFWSPDETRRSGLSVSDSDSTSTTNLEYYDPARYNLYRSDATGKPFFFTLMDSLVYLQPTPDDSYIVEAIERPLQSGAVIPDPYVAAVSLRTLWTMASDQNKLTPALDSEYRKITQVLVNGEQRVQQRFYNSRERLGMSRHRRWG